MAALVPTTEKGRATRERIVQAAAELVAEKGAAATSLDDVGWRSGASRSQLYHYFEDRDDLIRAVIVATTEAVLGYQDRLLDDLDSWAGIDRWFRALVDLQIERRARGGCPIGTLAGQLAERDPRARAAIADGLDRWERQLRRGLERMQKRGKLSSAADPAKLATATMALLQGGLLLTQVRRDPQQLRIALDAARTVLRSAGTSARSSSPART
ncbi:MAG TPA: TetR/AcrR family transcriptional regulator [Solirubrobacteraceae bacterium]|nr:TetR/AcrR family transcriptional regulator [Solirubrobacteraceae bacterium]